MIVDLLLKREHSKMQTKALKATQLNQPPAFGRARTEVAGRDQQVRMMSSLLPRRADSAISCHFQVEQSGGGDTNIGLF